MKRKRDYKAEYWRSGRKNYFRHKRAHTTFYDTHKEHCLKKTQEWVKKNPERRREIARNWYHRHKRVVLKKAKERYWKNVDEIRREHREEANRRYHRNIKLSRQRQRAAYALNRERRREYAGWYLFRKRFGLNLTEGRKKYLCLRKVRKELALTMKAWKDGAISDAKMRQRLRQLASRLQLK